MRPVRLTMQAFGPYAGREVVDFRDAVAAGLFGVYGQTGSGKSTVFSAMTFALFGEAAKAEQDPPSLRSDHAEADMPTEVELVFELGDKRFVVVRRPEQKRLKQRGAGETRDAHEAYLFDAKGLALDEIGPAGRGKVIVEKKIGLVGDAIRGLLGYGAEQFRQIVLLPQGRFETFLAANTRDRMGILRDLFDVSIYRRLAAKMKTDAEAAERDIRAEREVCAKRLNAEKFESVDALLAGVAEAGTQRDGLRAEEAGRRTEAQGAQGALAAAKTLDGQFLAAEGLRAAVAALEAASPAIDALAEQVAKAERAKTALDLETALGEAARDEAGALDKSRGRKEDADGAARRRDAAVAALAEEQARAGEIEAIRQDCETLKRHAETVEQSVAVKAGAQAAAATEVAARKALDEAQAAVAGNVERRQKGVDLLSATLATVDQRRSFRDRLAALEAVRKAAEDHAKAAADVAKSDADFARVGGEHRASLDAASRAKRERDAAERRLAEAQALHLAAKLAPGEACPVCGALDHPAPATGAIEHAGLDAAFRDAKELYDRADRAARDVEGRLSGVASVLEERRGRLAALGRPERGLGEIAADIAAEQRALEALGKEVSVEAVREGIDKVAAMIADAEAERDACRERHSVAQTAAAGQRAKLEQMLSSVPEPLRAAGAANAALTARQRALAERERQRDAIVDAERKAREAAIVASGEAAAAEGKLNDARDRLAKARLAFEARLAETGLSTEAFAALKPAIARIEQDKARVEDHRGKLVAARGQAVAAEAAIAGRERPDVSAVEQVAQAAETALAAAAEARGAADHRLTHLQNLRDELDATFKWLAEAEAATGPLRGLAQVFDAKNPQNLDLETYAIGAMFDQVLAAANQRLGPMTASRYRLERELEAGRGRRGLGIQVFDAHTGRARPAATLSGGETFIAALALALGLADVVESASGKVRLDVIFIDEGFGSLDAENGSGTLDQVLQVLSGLVAQNRAVGLISHVPLVQEAIPNGFYVRKDIAGSRIEARGAL